MATLSDLVIGIRQDTSQEVERISHETAQELERIELETVRLETLKRREYELVSQAKAHTEEIRQQLKAELIEKRLQLHHQRQIVNEVFSEASKRILALPTSSRNATLVRMLNKVRREMEIGSASVASKDLRFFQKTGIPFTIAPHSGGFVAISRDRLVTMDFRYQTVFEQAKRDCEVQVANILFPRGKR